MATLNQYDGGGRIKAEVHHANQPTLHVIACNHQLSQFRGISVQAWCSSSVIHVVMSS